MAMTRPTSDQIAFQNTVALPQSLTVDGTTLVVDGTNNRVGIGVAAPTTALDVAGNINLTGSISGSTVGALAASLLPSGSVLQVVEAVTTTVTDFTSTTGWAPISGMSVTITPKRATSKIFVIASWQTWLWAATTGSSWIGAQIVRGATALSTHGNVLFFPPSVSQMSQLCIFDSESSPGTSAVTYSLQLQSSRGISSTTYNPQMASVGWSSGFAGNPNSRHRMIVVEVAV